jgi:hypothetical protein
MPQGISGEGGRPSSGDFRAQRMLKNARWQWQVSKLATDKWLGAIKSAEGSRRLTSTNEKEHSHAQNEDQERR